MNKKNKINIGVVAVIIIAVAIGIWFYTKPANSTPAAANLDAFAQCLKDKGAVMYGAAWCSHCQAQKKLFGDSFKHATYVECPDNTQVCIDQGVENYPTWILASGEKLVGEQTLQTLADKTSCPLQ